MTQPLAEALRACLALMDRGAPHPLDTDRWHDTIRQASTVLAQETRAHVRRETVRSLQNMAYQLRTFGRDPRLLSDEPRRTLRRIAILVAIGLAVFLAHCANPARAESSVTWYPRHNEPGLPSVMELHPSQAPGAVAEVTLFNQDVHAFTSETHVLDIPGLVVTVTLDIDPDRDTPDRLTVTPPEGFIAIPETLIVPEGTVGTILIYSTEGVGA